MKMIHCADLHLDSKMESNLDRDAANLRRDEPVSYTHLTLPTICSV